MTARVTSKPTGWPNSRIWACGFAASLLLLPLAAWLLRHPIAAHFVERELGKRGVQARYRIEHLGFGRQVLVDVEVGPPRHRDLTARRMVVHTSVGWSGVTLSGLDVDGLRLRAALIDGRLSLGQVDRLLPPSTAGPFRLPDLPLAIDDAVVDLTTPAGRVELAVHGQGNLARRFRGAVRFATARLAGAGCAVSRVRGTLAVTVLRGAPSGEGPVALAKGSCDGLVAENIAMRPHLASDPSFQALRVAAPIRMSRVSGAGATVRSLEGRLALSGRPERFAGSVDVAADEVGKRDVLATQVRVRATLNGRAAGIGGTLALSSASARYAGQKGSDVAARGRYQVRLGPSPRGMFEGQLVARAIELSRSVAPSLLTLGRGLNGTPLQAPARRFGLAADAALRRFQLFADVRLLFDQGSAEALVRRGQLTSASGARVALTSSGATGLRVDSADPAAFTVDARVTSSGGGLPVADVRVSRTAAGAFAGVAEVEPYTAGGSSISLSPVRFARGSDGRTTVKGTVELTGPFAGGRVERARLPLALVLGRSGELTVNTACVPLSFDEASISGVTLGATTLRLCPEAGRAVLRRSAAGALSAGARVDDIALSGQIGQTPVRLSSGPASVELTNGRFSVSDLEARVGAGESVTRLDLGSLSGAFRGKGARGRFDGAAGQVGAVPIVWSKGAGRWSLDGGRLALAARLVVDDATTPRRFETLVAPDFELRFGGSLIEARGTLIEPATRRPVTAVTLNHSFRSASGQADLAVRDLRFDDALQPSGLTQLALGVVANVRGEVSGDARVAWGGTEGVVSTGTFRTTGMDLAAAFGPVAGLSTTVRFTDLLNLVTADDQLLTVDEINPGTSVLDGRVRYALVPGRRIAVRDGRWPFAGGRLTLRPTVLDFADGSSQRFVVDVDGLDAAVLVQDLEFENIAATGLFDGRLPLVFTGGEGRVDGGRLSSRAPGGTLAYVGAVTQEDLGFFPNLAFEALKSLRYDQLDITMEGPLSGSMVTAMRFDGLAQGAGAKRNLLARAIEGLPFVFKIRVTAPFRQLLATARSFNDPSGLVERNLGLLYEEQRRLLGDPSVEVPSVQPKESEPVP